MYLLGFPHIGTGRALEALVEKRLDMKKQIKFMVVFMMALTAFGCSKKNNNTNPTYGNGQGIYQWNGSTCVQTSTGQQVAQSYCQSQNQYGGGYGNQYGGNQYGGSQYGGGSYGGGFGGGIYGQIGFGGGGGVSMCYGTFAYMGRVGQCYGYNCSGYVMTEVSTGRTVMCQ